MPVNPSELPLQECDRSPKQVASDREIAETIEAQIQEIARLRGQVAVLTHAKESDTKRFRTIALERHREREELNAELGKLKVGLSGHAWGTEWAAGELWCILEGSQEHGVGSQSPGGSSCPGGQHDLLTQVLTPAACWRCSA